MERNKRNKSKRYKFSTALVGIIAVLAAVVGYRHFFYQKQEKHIVSNFKSKANISIDKIHQTATRNGVTQWSLDAASMNYFAEKKQSFFQDLSVTFFLKDRSEVYLTADKGVLKTVTNDIGVSGNVIVENGDYRLKTEKLFYKHDKQLITSNVPVKITGDSLDLAADSMSLDLNTKMTVLKGNVKGILSEKIVL